ncbi:MAG TPA: hypothetical protein VNC39_14135 [Acidocella sp.]|uniref:hypothetical protein n=1 Tax=Acidocella sp. TaxID=50710 RepID=UPI002C6C7273|nr:hypothetical protein [Acidocella sp.]HVE23106.1 hypothetical protein [Acidocella sp.]
MSSFSHLVGSSAKPEKSSTKKTAKEAHRSYAHLNKSIPALQAAAEQRQVIDRASAEKAAAKKLATRMNAAAKRGVR